MSGTGKMIALIKALSGGEGGGGGSQWTTIQSTVETIQDVTTVTLHKTWAEIADASQTRALTISVVDSGSYTVSFYPIQKLRIDDDEYGETHYRVVANNYSFEFDAGSSPDNYPVFSEEGK